MSWSEFNIHAHLEDSLENTASDNSSLKFVDVCSRFIDIKTSDDDHFRRDSKISFGDGDVADGLADGIDIISLFS